MKPKDAKRSKRSKRSWGWIFTILGACMVMTAAFAGAYAISHQLHQDYAGRVLLQSAGKSIAAHQHKGPCQLGDLQQGQLSGILSIPALNLKAPVEEGTDDAELNVAVGHDPYSVWPGTEGAAVFLAHDVSYFVHLNNLKTGDVITYQTACSTAKFAVSTTQVVAAGSSVANTTSPSLVLDTCWPPNALFFTSKRYLVRATELSNGTGGTNLAPGQQLVTAGQSFTYTSTAPAPLITQGLTLDQNYAPMGTMQLVNASVAFSQSPGPLSLEHTALESYFGAFHAGAQRQAAWWAALAPGVSMPPELLGTSSSPHYDSPLNVEIDSGSDGVPSQVVLRTTVTLSGGGAPGTHTETVVLPVHKGIVTIGSWQFS